MAHRVCPWWAGYFLACPLRRWFQDPGAILAPYISEGLTVLEPGPGMGFFTLELARRVGPQGRVIVVDIQRKMLEILAKRARKAGLAERIDIRQAKVDHLGVEDYTGKVDFAMAFAMVHEVSHPEILLSDIQQALKSGGRLLIAEPLGHVRAPAFKATLQMAERVGFVLSSQPVIRGSHAAVLARG